MNKQQIISKFLNKTFSITKEEFLQRENITEALFKESNSFNTSSGKICYHYEIISFYVDFSSNILFKKHKSIPNKKFIVIKMPSKEQQEELYKKNIYNFDNYKIEENYLLSLLNPELSTFLSCKDGFNLLKLLYLNHIPKEFYDDLIHFINIKNNIEDF